MRPGRFGLLASIVVASCAPPSRTAPGAAPHPMRLSPKHVVTDLSVDVLDRSPEEGGRGTMHYADRVTVRLRSKWSPPLVLTNPRDPAESGEFLPLFDKWLETEEPRTVLLLGWSSYGAGMRTVHAWVLRVPDDVVPVVVEKLAWTTDRGSVGLVIDSSKHVRVGVPWTFDDAMHDAGEWKLAIGARSQWLEDVKRGPFTKSAAPYTTYRGPFGPGSVPAGTRVAWFDVTPSGFRPTLTPTRSAGAAAAEESGAVPIDQREDGDVEGAIVAKAEKAQRRRDARHVRVKWLIEAKAKGDANVTVALVVALPGKAAERFELGELNADSDSAPPGPKNCPVAIVTRTRTEQNCGGTPSYNSLEASVKGNELVVTLVTGTDGVPRSEKKTEVKRIPLPAHATLAPMP